jgi:hypothetical protein
MDPSELVSFVTVFTIEDETRAKRIYFGLCEAVDNLLRTYNEDPQGEPDQLAEVIWLANCIACRFDILMGHPIVENAPTCRVDSLNLVLTPHGMSEIQNDRVENVFERVHQNLTREFTYDPRLVRVFDELLQIHRA